MICIVSSNQITSFIACVHAYAPVKKMMRKIGYEIKLWHSFFSFREKKKANEQKSQIFSECNIIVN